MQAHSWTIQSSINLTSSAYPERAYDNSFGDVSTSASLVTSTGVQVANTFKSVTYRCTVDMTNLSAATLKVRRTYTLPHTPEDSLNIEVWGPGEVRYTYEPSSSGITDITYSWDNITYYPLSALSGGASGLVQSTVTNEAFPLANYTGSTNLNTLYVKISAYSSRRSEDYIDEYDDYGYPIVRTVSEAHGSNVQIYDIGVEATANALGVTLYTTAHLIGVDETYNGQNTYKYQITNTINVPANNIPCDLTIGNHVKQIGTPVYTPVSLDSYNATINSVQTVTRSYIVTLSGPIEVVPTCTMLVNSVPVPVTKESSVLVTHLDWQYINPIAFDYEGTTQKPWCLNYYNPTTNSYVQSATSTKAPQLVKRTDGRELPKWTGYFKGFKSISRYWPDTGPAASYDEQAATPVYPNEHTAYSTYATIDAGATYDFDGLPVNPSYTSPVLETYTWTFTDNVSVSNPMLKLVYSSIMTAYTTTWESYVPYDGGPVEMAGSITGSTSLDWQYSKDSGTTWNTALQYGITDRLDGLGTYQNIITMPYTERFVIPGEFNLNTLQIRLIVSAKVNAVTGPAYAGGEQIYYHGAGGSSSANVYAVYVEG